MFLLTVRYSDQVRHFELGKPDVSVGRAGADIVVDDPMCSREHVRISVRGDRVHIADLNSRNGTWIDGRKIGSRELTPGDKVSIGNVELELVHENIVIVNTWPDQYLGAPSKVQKKFDGYF